MVVIFILAVLLLWSAAEPAGSGGSGQADAVPSPDRRRPGTALPTPSPAGGRAQLIPNFVGRSFDEIRTSELYAQYRFVPTEEYSSEYSRGRHHLPGRRRPTPRRPRRRR